MAIPLSVRELQSCVGTEVALSGWIDVTQDVIDEFADAVHDLQWIHVDPGRAARESPFRDAAGQRRTVAHGFLTLSLLTRMLEDALEFPERRAGVNVGFNRVRFTGPVTSGSRIRGRFSLLDLKPVQDGVQLAWDVTVECEGHARPVLVAEWLTRIVTTDGTSP
jgi:acyl dehydratase